MTNYPVRRKSNLKAFRMFAYGSVGLMLIVLALSRLELDDRVSRVIGWGAGGLLVAGMLAVFVLLFKNSIDEFWQEASFDVTDDKIICLFEGRPPREFLLRDITLIGESRTGLLVLTNEPSKGFFIPRSTGHFEQLKRQLSEHCTVEPAKNTMSFVPILPPVLLIALYGLLFTTGTRILVLVVGFVALLFQGWATFAMRKMLAKTTSPRLVITAFIFSWLVLLWLVYQRATSTPTP